MLVYASEPLKAPLRIAGAPFAELYASTSGSDSDWVVKLIDVWPDEVPEKPVLGGYQQMLSADIFRGRYREDLATPHPLAPNRALHYRIRLPNASHTFLPGHLSLIHISSHERSSCRSASSASGRRPMISAPSMHARLPARWWTALPMSVAARAAVATAAAGVWLARPRPRDQLRARQQALPQRAVSYTHLDVYKRQNCWWA